MEAVAEHIADRPLLELIQRFLKQGVMESGKGWQPTEKGTPQGAVISPLLANLYLNPLDHLMARTGREMVRYADDFVILCQSEKEAHEVLEQLRQWVAGAGLTLHPTKTRIVNASEKGGFDFLGYHFERGHRWPRQKSLDKFRETIRQKTGRLRPGSMGDITGEVNRTMRGWFEYFKHSIKNVFEKEDRWVRGRLQGHSEKTAQRTRTRTGTRPSTLAQCLLRRTGAILLSHSPSASEPISQENPLTGKPDARNGPVRFGGRGGFKPSSLPLSRKVANDWTFVFRFPMG